MERSVKKVISLFLSVLLMMSCASAAASAATGEYIPSIVVPGIFQSEIKLYNKDGSPALDDKGQEYPAPFFLDSTTDIVAKSVMNAIVPLSMTLLTQEDRNALLADTVADLGGEILFGKTLATDANGEFLYDVRATKYDKAIKYCSDYDREYVYSQIPLIQYSQIAGEDKLFFFSYYSFGSVKQTAEELYQFILSVKQQTGSDKVNIVPISQGGTVANALLALHPEVMDSLNRIVYIIPALDGANLIGELFTNGLADSDNMLYLEMFPKLFGADQQWLAQLVNIVLRVFPNADVNQIIDKVVQELVGKYMKRSTLMLALVPSAYYPKAAELYLQDKADAEYKAESEWYYQQAQLKSDENILKAIEKGVEVFDIVDYNSEVYALVKGYNDQNGDGIIHLDSTSMGATSFGVDVPLPEGYTTDETKCRCTDPSHVHTDAGNLIDASTGLLPEHTFYFKDQNHERTAQNDVIIKLATRLLTDESFKDVHSYPEQYPQFNTGRLARSAQNAVKKAEAIDRSTLSEEQIKELDAAISEVNAILEQTNVTPELNTRLNEAESKLNETVVKVTGGTPAPKKNVGQMILDVLLAMITVLLRYANQFLLERFGGMGYFEMIKAA